MSINTAHHQMIASSFLRDYELNVLINLYVYKNLTLNLVLNSVRQIVYGWQMDVQRFGNFFFFKKKKSHLFFFLPLYVLFVHWASLRTLCNPRRLLWQHNVPFAPDDATVVSPALCLLLSSEAVKPEQSCSVCLLLLSAPCLVLQQDLDGISPSQEKRRKDWLMLSACVLEENRRNRCSKKKKWMKLFQPFLFAWLCVAIELHCNDLLRDSEVFKSHLLQG